MFIFRCLFLSEVGSGAGAGLHLRMLQFDSIIASASQTWESMERQGMFFRGHILFSAIKASFKKCQEAVVSLQGVASEAAPWQTPRREDGGRSLWSGEWQLALARHPRFVRHGAREAPAAHSHPHSVSASQVLCPHFSDEEPGAGRGMFLPEQRG